MLVPAKSFFVSVPCPPRQHFMPGGILSIHLRTTSSASLASIFSSTTITLSGASSLSGGNLVPSHHTILQETVEVDLSHEHLTHTVIDIVLPNEVSCPCHEERRPLPETAAVRFGSKVASSAAEGSMMKVTYRAEVAVRKRGWAKGVEKVAFSFPIGAVLPYREKLRYFPTREDALEALDRLPEAGWRLSDVADVNLADARRSEDSGFTLQPTSLDTSFIPTSPPRSALQSFSTELAYWSAELPDGVFIAWRIKFRVSQLESDNLIRLIGSNALRVHLARRMVPISPDRLGGTAGGARAFDLDLPPGAAGVAEAAKSYDGPSTVLVAASGWFEVPLELMALPRSCNGELRHYLVAAITTPSSLHPVQLEVELHQPKSTTTVSRPFVPSPNLSTLNSESIPNPVALMSRRLTGDESNVEAPSSLFLNPHPTPLANISDDLMEGANLRKNGNGPVIVQKYGGTSVGKFLNVIGGEVLPSYLDAGNRVVVVCSARSGTSKTTGTTNLLLRAALEALRPRGDLLATPLPILTVGTPVSSPTERVNPLTTQIFQRAGSSSIIPTSTTTTASSRSGTSTPGSLSASMASLRAADEGSQVFNATVDQIKEDHFVAARAAIKDEAILRELEDDLDYDCERLRSFLMAAQIIDEISARSKDIIMGVGERLSCRIVTASLRDQGIDAELVSLESIVEAAGEDDEPTGKENGHLGQAFYDRLSKRLGDRLIECGDRVPVVTGFFGVVPGSLLAQVGRGYTDLCAALCAVGLSASELQIWKEVDGIFTADPRKVPTARLLAMITPEEAAELTYYGSEVIHPFTMEQAIRSSVPIRIKNVENPRGNGTIIFPDPPSPSGNNSDDEVPKSRSSSRAAEDGAHQPRRGPTAVTIKDNIIILSIRSNRKTISHGFFASIFGTLDRYGIVVDLISTSEVYVSMAINGTIRNHVLDRIRKDLKAVGEVQVNRDMAILSLVGKHMKNMVGIAGKMFSTLAEGNINIEMISQGASEINISCVIDGRDAVKALNVVHHKLLSAAHPSSSGVGPWLF
ncbi:hypothetical protein RQP46_001475 [Phenoliferia psychrophenolica]